MAQPLIRRLLVVFFAAVLNTAAFALEVVAEGESLIENDDLGMARQLALRRAMASAVEQSGGIFHATTVSTPVGVQERTSLSSRNRILAAKIVSERVEKGLLRVVAEVRLAGPGQPASCTERPLRKALVSAFPLQLPEQLGLGEYTGWPAATAEHLARVFNASGHLLAAAAPTKIPYAALGEIELERKEGIPVLVDWGRQARAQYVVSGIFRDFGTTRPYLFTMARQLVVEAFIHDGISGELIARQEFARELSGNVRLPRNTVFGGRAFCESILGSAYLDMMAELARWAENTLGCLPFSARVIQANGTRLHLDVGSDSGIEPGMEFLLARDAGSSVATQDGTMLGREHRPLAGIVIRQVHPRYSEAEITARKNPPVVRPGDVIYGH